MQVVLDVPVRLPGRNVQGFVGVCDVCDGGQIICAYHPTRPLGHDGCEDPGMPCPRCLRTTKTDDGRISKQALL